MVNVVFLGEQVATLTGHTMRVLYLASSPDGQVNPNPATFEYLCIHPRKKLCEVR
jgi:hypothetical protein